MTPGPAPARDAGLQGERTSLAWRRTALSASVAALVLTRYGIVRADVVLTGAGVALLAAAAATGYGAHLRHAQIDRAVTLGASPVNRAAVRTVAVGVALVGLLAVAAILLAR
ncbi:MAG: DUF202 domain-containing protein [Frankiales bacterium]|nr:DUF202 domain-containing protein [Frankiales bacterium]